MTLSKPRGAATKVDRGGGPQPMLIAANQPVDRPYRGGSVLIPYGAGGVSIIGPARGIFCAPPAPPAS